MKYLFSLILLMLILFSCTKEEAIGPVFDGDRSSLFSRFDSGVIIINEGTFQKGNGSLGFYNQYTKEIQHQIFRNINGYPLGDVVQSMIIHNDRSFIIVNNSGKVEVVSSKDLTGIATITGFSSPRHMEVIGNKKAYVTDFKANKVAVVDLSSYEISKYIPISGWTEQLVKTKEGMWIANMDSSRIYLVDTTEDKVKDTINVSREPNSMHVDINGKLWVLCSGGYDNIEFPALYQIEPETAEVIQKLEFNTKASSPGSLRMNSTRDSLYFLNKGVYKMSIYENILPSSPFIHPDNRLFYDLGIDPGSGYIYLGDALDYIQNGIVWTYSRSTGAFVDSFRSGVIPSGFVFPGK